MRMHGEIARSRRRSLVKALLIGCLSSAGFAATYHAGCSDTSRYAHGCKGSGELQADNSDVA